ncbi:universal stress protein [Actinokineospora auranticolor]|uniref:Nucleotide-binding universal stress UspA family protein n=1 Tax=Actinokineospora auranticolor TaxID=155976 RepID=A0A2S6H0D5_9PSEU|nr:universal stress protein [Actinokineospora auranticolor]PPK70945.1 nucleotide-binding universal stress UspA family protein [Actinokineospora auranticolor]
MSEQLPVLVAVDGSEESDAAVRWAAEEALRAGVGLRIVTAYPWPIGGYPQTVVTVDQMRDSLRAQAVERLAHGREVAERDGLEVHTSAVEGPVVPSLVEVSRDARLTVVGSRGLGAFEGMVLGSTGVALAAHAHSPVVVVRGEVDTDARKVVVGVDAEEDAALEFAFKHAAAIDSTVVAVHAWSESLVEIAYLGEFSAVDWTPLGDRAGEDLAKRLATFRERYPNVPVEQVVDRARATRLLLDNAKDATLLVVGTRGHGEFTGLILGSVGQALIRHAPCPVAIIRPTTS